MYCPNCGKIISDGSKFCSECGASVAAGDTASSNREPAKKIIKCRACNSTMQINADDHLGMCPYCNSKDLFDITEEEKRRQAELKAAEEEKRKKEIAEKLQKQEKEKKAKEHQANVENFGRGKLGWYIRYSMMAAMLLLVIACFVRSPIAILVSALQVVILIVDWLIGTGVIKKPFFGFVPIVMFLVWLMTFGYLYGMFTTIRGRVQQKAEDAIVQEMETTEENPVTAE